MIAREEDNAIRDEAIIPRSGTKEHACEARVRKAAGRGCRAVGVDQVAREVMGVWSHMASTKTAAFENGKFHNPPKVTCDSNMRCKKQVHIRSLQLTLAALWSH